MFDKERFEQSIYKLVTQEVNAVYSELFQKDTVQQEGFRVQRQIIQALHFIIEETVMQISYGLAISPSR